MSLTKSERRQRIKFRIRKIVSGTAAQPRLSVFRSNKEIYAQIIDDVNGTTIATVPITALSPPFPMYTDEDDLTISTPSILNQK